MINSIGNREKCCGCGACAASCPTGAMTMAATGYEPYRPNLDEVLCANCGKCVRACPLLQKETKEPDYEAKLFEAIAASEKLVANSSSGGMFPLLANAVFERGGAVAGVQFGDDFIPEFVLIENERELVRLKKSKYIQARTGDIFKHTEKTLQQNRLVLFSGCPCQIAGLKSYLGKEYDNLYLIDLLCKYSPPIAFWKQYFGEEFGDKNVSSYEFRSKEYGWNIDCLKITFADGSTEIRRLIDDSYQRVFHSMEMMPEHCAYCRYQTIPREGDITLGDFHGIAARDPFVDEAYKKGISALIVNTRKGEKMLEWIRSNMKILKAVPIDWLGGNADGLRLRNGELICPNQTRFINLLKKGKTFRQAVDIVKGTASHIAVIGTVNVFNFGALANNFALWSKLREFGYAVDLIFQPRSIGESHIFMSKPMIKEQLGDDYVYSCLPQLYNYTEMRNLLNNRYQLFVTGSDQTLRPDFPFHENSTLGWLTNAPPRISYASSFGIREPDNKHPYVFDQIAYELTHYGRVSVRESDAMDLLGTYGIKAAHTLEPVLLHSADFWSHYASKRDSSGHIFAYILDPSTEKDLLLGFARGKLGTHIEQFGEMWSGGTFGERMGSIINSDFVITDSFHGMCFAIVFRKPFIAIVNDWRGAVRFTDLAKKLRLASRLVESAGEALARPELFGPFDWINCETALDAFRNESVNWLKEALYWAFTSVPELLKHERTVDESLIWYGAGQGAQRLLLFLDKLGLPYPCEIWDINAWPGRELGGVLVTWPNFESLNGRKDIKIVITIENAAIYDEVTREFRNNGFYNIVTFDEADRQLRQMLREVN